jgi:hypothetical protein
MPTVPSGVSEDAAGPPIAQFDARASDEERFIQELKGNGVQSSVSSNFDARPLPGSGAEGDLTCINKRGDSTRTLIDDCVEF